MIEIEQLLRFFERLLRTSCLAIFTGLYGSLVSIGVLVLIATIGNGHPGEVAGLAGLAGFIAGAAGGLWGNKRFLNRIAWAGASAAFFGPSGGYLLLVLMGLAGAPL